MGSRPEAKRERKIEADLALARRFTEVYCRRHRHNQGTPGLCTGCQELVDYARARLERCPYDPKPKCKKCPTHCYKPALREQMKQVMRFSGMHFVKRGRLDWLLRYFLT